MDATPSRDTTTGGDNYPNSPVGDVFSTTGVDHGSAKISYWGIGSDLTVIVTDPEYKPVIEVTPHVGERKPAAGIGFTVSETIQPSTAILSFIVKSDVLTAIDVEISEMKENDDGVPTSTPLTCDLDDAVNLDDDWREVYVPLSDFKLTGEDISTFAILGGHGEVGTFLITEVQLFYSPWELPIRLQQ